MDIIWKMFGYDTTEDKVEIKPDLIVTQPRKQTHLIKIQNPQNYYYLSLIKEPNNSWSIHGLWPQYNINKYPRFCHSADFDISQLDPIIDNLNKYWYSDRGDDDIFWEHEYLKHGTCNFNKFDEFTYFKTTLELFDKALSLNLPDQFYNINTNKCLIPVNQKLEFFQID